MHDKFTERVRKVIYLAREEAARLQHDYIGTEHLLLGVIREGEGIAATVLNNLGLDLDRIRQEVENMVSASGGTMTIGEIPFTPRAKRVLELAVEEARSLGHNYVGTEHLLLGLLREDRGIAALVLKDAGITIDPARQRLIEILRESSSEAPASALDRHGVRRRPVSPPGPSSPASAAMAASIVELLAQDDAVGAVFAAQGIDVAKLAAALRSLAVPPSPGASDTAA